MAKRRKKQQEQERPQRQSRGDKNIADEKGFWSGLRDETRNSIIGLFFIILAIILLFAAFNNGGYLGGMIYNAVHFLFGLGYYVMPALFVLLGINFFRAGGHNFTSPALVAGPFFALSALGLLSLFDQSSLTSGLGGFVGYYIMSPMIFLFAPVLSGMILTTIFVIAILILFDVPLHLGFMLSFLKLFRKEKGSEEFAEEEDTGDALVEATKADPIVPAEVAPVLSEEKVRRRKRGKAVSLFETQRCKETGRGSCPISLQLNAPLGIRHSPAFYPLRRQRKAQLWRHQGELQHHQTYIPEFRHHGRDG